MRCAESSGGFMKTICARKQVSHPVTDAGKRASGKKCKFAYRRALVNLSHKLAQRCYLISPLLQYRNNAIVADHV